MSFFKRDRDLSAYPQPVLVTPDPRTRVASNDEDGNDDNIAKEVAEAASTPIHDSDHSTTSSPAITESKGKGKADTVDTGDKGGEQSATKPLSPSLAGENVTATGDDGADQGEASLQGDKGPQDTTETAFQDLQDQRAWTDGIMSVLGPVIQEMDFNIVSVCKSQVELEKEIERLTAELQLFMDSAATPPEVEPAIRKLSLARKQIMTASTTLRTVQDRVDRMCVQAQRKR
ncbi:hypothetical protein BGW41_007602 [Actinomortierella wolfii]|nr:hypothetical protein BGW41_007602 [Actinomortierella wolfii]